MFYLVRNLKTCLNFVPHDMDKLNKPKQIIQALRQKMQGLCFTQFGYIVKVIRDKSAYSEEIPQLDKLKQQQQGEEREKIIQEKMLTGQIKQFIISTPQIDQYGIKIYITFSAICFKAQKNDLIQFIVQLVEQQSVTGRIGPVEVVAPRRKIEGFEYQKDERILVSRSLTDGRTYKIDKKTKIKAKCISSKIQMNNKMIIIVEIPKFLNSYIQN